MRPKTIVGLLTVTMVGGLIAAAPLASAQTDARRGVCAEKTVGQLHVQIGYCP